MNKRAKLLKKLAELLNVENELFNPVEKIHKIQDKKDLVYLWDMNCTDQQADAIKSQIKSQFVKQNNRDPKALHVVTPNVDNFEQMEPDMIREIFGPWLDQVENE